VEANLKSLRILEEITTSDPSNFEFLKQTHLTYNKTGDIFLRRGRLAEALGYYRRGAGYVARMSTLNDNPQIAVLRGESHLKMGGAQLALAAAGRDAAALDGARAHLEEARAELVRLRERNELGKNYEHKLALVNAELARAASLAAR
jgi:hypothetical protein